VVQIMPFHPIIQTMPNPLPDAEALQAQLALELNGAFGERYLTVGQPHEVFVAQNTLRWLH
jgi:hypothetical protein